MSIFISNISNYLFSISLMFKGQYINERKEIMELKNEMFTNSNDFHITCDKINLSNDMRAVSNDLRKSLNLYKTEKYGETAVAS